MQDLNSGSRLQAQHSMGQGVHLQYDNPETPFKLSANSLKPPIFHFEPGHVEETFVGRQVHAEVLSKYRIYCDDFVLVSGSVQEPERVFLVKRAEEPLMGQLWPLGGRAVNCPSQDSPLAVLWKAAPLEASLFLSIFRESNLQPHHIDEIRTLGGFNVVFQNQPDCALFNRDHPAKCHAVFVKPESLAIMNLAGAKIVEGSWLDSHAVEELYKNNAILPHVKAIIDAIFGNEFRAGFISLADYSI